MEPAYKQRIIDRLWNGSWKVRMIFISAVFAVVWTALIYPNIDALNSLSHSLQFTISLILLVLTAYILGTSIDGSVKKMAGILCILLAGDLLLFPLMVSRTGIASEADLSGSSIDVVINDAWTSIGVPAQMRWLFTYPVAFMLLITAGLFLLESERDIRGAMRRGLI